MVGEVVRNVWSGIGIRGPGISNGLQSRASLGDHQEEAEVQ